jgi:hypothetical protein
MLRVFVGLLACTLGVSQVRCPDGFTAPSVYTGFCYRYNSATLTWNAHENACTQVTYNGLPYAGGHLATLFSQESATVVMNQYCNNLNVGQSHYFIGYYCISSSYAFRPDWRWSSGISTNWIHSSPTYLSGAEPDDAGCGRAHYSDDGASPGKIGDWVCSSPLAGGCCEAPVIPTPSATVTASSTQTSSSTNTVTRTRTASNTETSTQTASQTYTPTSTSTVTITRTQTQTSTSTSTGTRTRTPTTSETPSLSVSPSLSTSPSVSSSPSASVTASSSPSVSTSVTQSVTVTSTFTKTPLPVRVAGLNDGAQLSSNQLKDDFTLQQEQQEETNKNIAIIASSGVGAFLIILGLCCLWFCCVFLKRRKREKEARSKLNKKANDYRMKVTSPKMSNVLGVQTPTQSKTLSNVFKSMNPALVHATQPKNMRNTRMSVALSSYKNTNVTSFKPVAVRSIVEDKLIEEEPADYNEEEIIGVSEYEEEEEIEQEVEQEQTEEEDVVDEEESINNIQAKTVIGKSVTSGNTYTQKVKRTVESEVQPLSEPRKLIIGKGALLQEQVEKQTVKLRRVSRVKGDKDLTATRQVSRPSAIAFGGYEPQRPQSYAFTATVSRTIVKSDTELQS